MATVPAVSRPPHPPHPATVWTAAGAVLAVGYVLVCAGLRLFLGLPDPFLPWLIPALPILAAGGAAGLSPALRRRGPAVLAESIVVASIGALTVFVYLVVVVGLGEPVSEDERGLVVLSMVAAGIIALLVVPIRASVRRFAARLAPAERTRDQVVSSIAARMTRSLPLDELLLSVAEQLRAALHVDRVEVYTGAGGELALTAAVPVAPRRTLSFSPDEAVVVARTRAGGTRWSEIWVPALASGGGALRVVPLSNQGELLGLIAARRAGEVDFDADEERVMVELARQVALALKNARLDSALQHSLDELSRRNTELRDSRSRIVTASNETRRTIERNLHDGAQQHLVALAVKLGIVEQLVALERFADVRPIVAELRGDVQTTVQEVRELAHGIYPPLLRDRGLAEALRAAAGRCPLPVTVDAADLPRRSPDLEAAIYFCCVEALQNAGKYAGDGATVTVAVREEAGKLAFRVSDDGAGFAQVDGAPAGHGFTNMLDRLGALGGTLTVSAAPGAGVTILGAVPIPLPGAGGST